MMAHFLFQQTGGVASWGGVACLSEHARNTPPSDAASEAEYHELMPSGARPSRAQVRGKERHNFDISAKRCFPERSLCRVRDWRRSRVSIAEWAVSFLIVGSVGGGGVSRVEHIRGATS